MNRTAALRALLTDGACNARQLYDEMIQLANMSDAQILDALLAHMKSLTAVRRALRPARR